MKEWFNSNERGELVFRYGKQAPDEAQKAAGNCRCFEFDAEEELYTDNDERMCYNCLFRKWTKDSFICCGFFQKGLE